MAGGLKEGDKILEVNGKSILQESHLDVVQKLKEKPKEVQMLVVDAEADAYYTEKGTLVHSNMPNVTTIICTEENPHTGKT